jgi:hypothetical protein
VNEGLLSFYKVFEETANAILIKCTQFYVQYQCAGYLFAAVNHLVKNWKTIHFYFPYQGEEETNSFISTFIKVHENRNNDELTLPEGYIYFLHNYLSFVTKPVSKMKDHATHSAYMYDILQNLRKSKNSK